MAKKAISSWLKQASHRNHSQLGEERRSLESRARSKHEPHLGGLHECRGVVTIDHSTSPATGPLPRVDFTALSATPASLSRRVLFASIQFHPSQSSLEHVAFRNSDGSIVLLVLNPVATAHKFQHRLAGRNATYTLQPSTVVTFRWSVKSRATSLKKAGTV